MELEDVIQHGRLSSFAKTGSSSILHVKSSCRCWKRLVLFLTIATIIVLRVSFSFSWYFYTDSVMLCSVLVH